MIGWAGQWTQTPSTTPLQPKQWNAHFCITFNIWCWPDRSMDLNLIHHPSPAKKNEMLIFWLCSTSDDQLGWSMDLNPIHHPSAANKMKCFFLDYVQLLMISQVDRWTQTPSATPLQPKKWNTHFWITFNFWWSAGLVDGLKPHSPPLSSQKNEMLIFWLCSTSDDQLGWSMDLNPIHHPSAANKMKCFFLDYVHFWWSARLIDGLKPHAPPLSSQKNEMLIFGLRSTSDDQLGWSWTQTPFTTPLQPKKWNAHFLIMFIFWWSARLVNGLKPHLPALSSQ